jgi:hypothetical protein
MTQRTLFKDISRTAGRQPKTDRLILARYLKSAAEDLRLDQAAIERAHAIIVRWADLETGGRLAELHETQLQGTFLSEVFGQALGYSQPAEGEEVWHLEQHYTTSAGQTPDAVLGHFRQGSARSPLAVIELKGAGCHLDRDRSAGRTAVDQCWDYLVNTPTTCRWGIISNLVSFRLYERDSTKRAYEHFSLQSLRSFEEFRKFYVLFHRKGLIEGTAGEPPRAPALLQKSLTRQREVSDKLYGEYSERRTQLISHLRHDLGYEVDQAVEYVQRLMDRIIFIAFCEDRDLLPAGSIKSAYEQVSPFARVTNPRWQNFKNLFRYVDEGSPDGEFTGYNGGLFAISPADDLELDDEWTRFFNYVGGYDFADEVNLDVLGNLFERSITELEKLKSSGLFGGSASRVQEYATMPQSAKRKQLGIYYTPAELTSRIVQYTVDELIAERFTKLAVVMGIAKPDAAAGLVPEGEAYWRGCIEILRHLKVVDPACGSGAFLFQAYNVLEQRYHEVLGHLDEAGAEDTEELAAQVSKFILNDNLYGVDLSPEAVEITQLALWIRSATPGQTLATLSRNIVHGNSLVHDAAVHPDGFVWRERFPEVFDREEAGFDCVVGNPPWERMDLSEREFFSIPAPEIATATTGAKRRKLVEALEKKSPELYQQYIRTKSAIDSQRAYCQGSGEYPLTGKGRTNLYAVFAELAYQIVAANGRLGLLTPSGIAFDNTTKDFFGAVSESNRLIRFYDFENKKVFFPEVHASFKFCILNVSGAAIKQRAADFIFFVHKMEDLEERDRHIALSGNDIKLLNPNTLTCPIFRTKSDAEITKAIYQRIPILVDKGRRDATGNPWHIRFKQGLFNQTSDSHLFREAADLKGEGFKLNGNRWEKGKQVLLPLYEAKMFRPYDHRYGTVYEETTNWVNQGQTFETNVTQHRNPEYLVQPRWWTSESNVDVDLVAQAKAFFVFRDITRSTDVRTLLATVIPLSGVINTAPIILFDDIPVRRQLCLLGCFNSFALDFVAKQKTGHIHMNFFIVEQLPVLSPDTYDKRCPWDRKTTLERWISERVLKLTCTAVDMLPLAEACEFSSGSFQEAYGGRLNKWDEEERARLMAELDAAYFLLYGIEREDAEYILSTFRGIHDRSRVLAGGKSVAENVLEVYDELAGRSGAIGAV